MTNAEISEYCEFTGELTWKGNVWMYLVEVGWGDWSLRRRENTLHHSRRIIYIYIHIYTMGEAPWIYPPPFMWSCIQQCKTICIYNVLHFTTYYTLMKTYIYIITF